MFLFLLLLTHLFHRYGAEALSFAPRDAVASPQGDASSPCSCRDTRSLFDIIWSCLTTIFICTWVSIHPNLPPPGERVWRMIARRLKLMFWTLIFPELILTWALRQWAAARKVTKTYQDRGWTMSHGFFLTMGGFYLCRGEDESLGTLSFAMLQELEQANEIMFTHISEDDIGDKSKGDILAKGIAVFQTTWFIVQCIARGLQGLALTELELVTLALASLNAMTYFFWWHKPLDAQARIPIFLRPESTYMPQPKLKRAEVIVEGGEVDRVISNSLGVRARGPTSSMGLFDRWIPYAVRDELKSFKVHVVGFKKNRQQEMEEYPWWFLIPVWLVVFPLYAIFLPVIELLGQFDSNQLEPGLNRVPTFYSPPTKPEEDRVAAAVFTAFGALFGALHCIAWKFTFPSHAEQTLWRVTSLMITATPVLLFIMNFCRLEKRMDEVEELDWHREKVVDRVIDILVHLVAAFGALLMFLYIPARLYLLVDSLVLLRDPPPSAFLGIEWTWFIPHLR